MHSTRLMPTWRNEKPIHAGTTGARPHPIVGASGDMRPRNCSISVASRSRHDRGIECSELQGDKPSTPSSDQHDVELYKVKLPITRSSRRAIGRIQYRIANVGEVLPAGGKAFTMLDLTYVYMDIYLPTADAGKAKSAMMPVSCLSAPGPRHPRQGHLHRLRGPVHAQGGGDQDRARQAHVPGQGAHRSRASACPCRKSEKRRPRSGLCEARSTNALAARTARVHDQRESPGLKRVTHRYGSVAGPR